MDTSKNMQLMYSQYMDVNETNRVCVLLESKKDKPSMIFTKSAVLSKVMKLIPQMKEAEADLDDKKNLNIEICNDDEPFVEMDVALIDEQDEDQNADIRYEQDESEDEEESDIESSKVQNTLDLIKDEIEPMLDPSIKIYSKSDNQPKITIPLVTQEPEKNQEVQQQALMPDEESEFAMREDQSTTQVPDLNQEVQQQALMSVEKSSESLELDVQEQSACQELEVNQEVQQQAWMPDDKPR